MKFVAQIFHSKHENVQFPFKYNDNIEHRRSADTQLESNRCDRILFIGANYDIVKRIYYRFIDCKSITMLDTWRCQINANRDSCEWSGHWTCTCLMVTMMMRQYHICHVEWNCDSYQVPKIVNENSLGLIGCREHVLREWLRQRLINSIMIMTLTEQCAVRSLVCFGCVFWRLTENSGDAVRDWIHKNLGFAYFRPKIWDFENFNWISVAPTHRDSSNENKFRLKIFNNPDWSSPIFF